jgi:hypothetical protein
MKHIKYFFHGLLLLTLGWIGLMIALVIVWGFIVAAGRLIQVALGLSFSEAMDLFGRWLGYLVLVFAIAAMAYGLGASRAERLVPDETMDDLVATITGDQDKGSHVH